MTLATIGNASSATAPSNPSANIGIQDFLRILTTQLNNQDPLKPMDNAQFVAQMAQFTALQEQQTTNDKLDTLLGVQAATQSVGLLGRTISIAAQDGSSQQGLVTAVDFSSGQAQLSVTINNQPLTGISLSSVIGVK